MKINKYIAACVTLSIFLASTMYGGAFLVVVVELLLLLATMFSIRLNSKVYDKKTVLLLMSIFGYLLLISVFFQTIQYNIVTTILLFSQIFFVMVIANSDKDRSTIEYVYKFFLTTMLLLAIYSIVVYLFGNKVLVYNGAVGAYTQNLNVFGITLSQSGTGGDQIGTVNVGSVLNNPNTLSYFSLIALYIVAFSSGKISKKIVKSIVLLVAIYISGSRLAIVLACFIPLMIIVKHYVMGNKVKNIIVAGSILLLIIVGAFNMDQIIANINFNGRMERWQVGIENITLFGRGLKSDELALSGVFGYDTAMHNSYIAMMDNFGIIMTVFLIILLIIILKNLIKSDKKREYLIEFSILSILLIASMSESIVFFVGGCNILFFITLFNVVNINNNFKVKQ